MKRKISRIIAMLLLGCMILPLVSGCSSRPSDTTLSMMFPTELRAEDCERFIRVLRAKFPDIVFDVEFIDSDSSARYQLQRLRHDDAPDLVWYTGVMDQGAGRRNPD